MSCFPAAPDFMLLDAIMLAYRMGIMRHEEQKVAMLAAARIATDAITFMTALENFGVGRRSELHSFVGQVLAAPDYYRAQYPQMLGLHKEGEAAPSFLNNNNILSLVEPFLTVKQQQVFYDAYWWFVRNHNATYFDPKKGTCIGVYVDAPKDNASTLLRFEKYLYALVHHKSKRVAQLYEGFPADIVVAVYERSLLVSQARGIKA